MASATNWNGRVWMTPSPATDSNATDNDGLRTYADEYNDCDGNCLSDIDMMVFVTN